ncbi:MAG: EF2563 family selenium-dependent molybdenum hydroxylase system protein [Mogibacterium sp.]|nr:EF2563 family selenium-dependent molybdenum hydroxylase system protein [Mogibacterium sp.]
MLVMIRGAGDLATGIAVRLHRAKFDVVMTEIVTPLSIRRSVCFSEAVRKGETTVEGIRAVHVTNRRDAWQAINNKEIPVIVSPDAGCRYGMRPDVFVDAAIAKRNLGTTIDFAPIVIGIGPGFTAGVDCHAVIESNRGHTLGRVITEGTAIPDTGAPGNIEGYTVERLLRSPAAGIVKTVREIGDLVEAGETVAYVSGKPMIASIRGTLRGLIADGTEVPEGLKCGDVDPRCRRDFCELVSDKALAIGGGVMEAILYFGNNGYENYDLLKYNEKDGPSEIGSGRLWHRKKSKRSAV